MKFFRYKQVARLNFVGFDDELNNVDSRQFQVIIIRKSNF